MRIDIRDHGAVEGGALCTDAIAAACAALQDGDELYVPSGRWFQHRANPQAPKGLARITGRKGVTVRLDGWLCLQPMDYAAGDDFVQLELTNCTGARVVGEGGVHGNMRAILAGGYTIGERVHGIEVGPGCEDVELRGLTVLEPWGDGVALYGGNPPTFCSRTRVADLRVYDWNRSGVAIQKRLAGAELRGLTLISGDRGDQCIDSEPSDSSTPGNLPFGPGDAPAWVVVDGLRAIRKGKIVGGVESHPVAVSVSGGSTTEPAYRWRFRNAEIHGDMESTDVWGLELEDVEIVGSPDTGPAMLFKKVASQMALRRVRITKQNAVALKLNYQSGGRPEDVLVEDLEAWAPQAVYAERCQRITLRRCRAEGNGSALPAFVAKALTDGFERFETDACRANGYAVGLRHAGIAGGPPLTVRAANNDLAGCTVARQDSGNVVDY